VTGGGGSSGADGDDGSEGGGKSDSRGRNRGRGGEYGEDDGAAECSGRPLTYEGRPLSQASGASSRPLSQASGISSMPSMESYNSYNPSSVGSLRPVMERASKTHAQ
jgi:hypothetical protein